MATRQTSTEPTQAVAARGSLARLLLGLVSQSELRLVLLIILVSAVIYSISPRFLAQSNFESIAMGFSMDALIAVGMVIVLVAGQFDVSVGAVMGLAGVTAGILMRDGKPIWFSILVGIVIAVVAGSFNGFLVSNAKVSRRTALTASGLLGLFVIGAFIYIGWNPLVSLGLGVGAAAAFAAFVILLVPRVRINALIATLGVMSVCRGGAFLVTKGASVGGLPPEITLVGRGQILGLPAPVVIMLVVVVLGDLLLRHWSVLQQSYYVGTNEAAAKLSGIKADIVLLGAFIFVALLSGIAGLMTVSRFSSVTPYLGLGAEMRVIAACVIGGASLSGGQGSIIGAMLGLMLVSIVNNGLVLNGVSSYWQEFVNGAILVVAVIFDMVAQRGRVGRT